MQTSLQLRTIYTEHMNANIAPNENDLYRTHERKHRSQWERFIQNTWTQTSLPMNANIAPNENDLYRTHEHKHRSQWKQTSLPMRTIYISGIAVFLIVVKLIKFKLNIRFNMNYHLI